MEIKFEKQYLQNKLTEIYNTDNLFYIDGTIYEIISKGKYEGDAGLVIEYDGETVTIPIYITKTDYDKEIILSKIPEDKLNSPIIKIENAETEITE